MLVIIFLNVFVDHLCFLSQALTDGTMKVVNSRLYVVDILGVLVLPRRVICLKILSISLVHICEVFLELVSLLTALSDSDGEFCFLISSHGFLFQPCLFVT